MMFSTLRHSLHAIRRLRDGALSWLLLLLLCQASLMHARSVTAPEAPAAWWADGGLLNSEASANNELVVIGQLKNTVWTLAKLLDTRYAAQGGCGDDLRATVRAWDRNFPATASAAAHTPDIVQDGAMLAVANQGQLKNMALKAYVRLKALGMPVVLKDRDAMTQGLTYRTVDPDTAASLPWSSGKNGAVALQGHLKFCFSFEVPVPLPGTGRVVAWGGNASGQSTVPAGLEDAVAVAAGAYHSLALKSSGQVVAWGRNDSGQTTVPAGLSGVVAIAAGASHSLAVKSDGSVVAWGNGDAGKTNVPAGLTGVVAVSAGLYHSLALKSDGTVVAWGAVNYGGGYYYNTFRADYGQARVPAGLAGVVAISAGFYHSLALKSDGTVVAWGAGDDPNQSQYSYQASPTSYVNRFPDNHDRGQVTVPPGLRATAITTSYLTSIAVRRDGTLLAWGENASASMPAGESNAAKVEGFPGIEYASTTYGTVVVNRDGTVKAWDASGDARTDVPAGLAGVSAAATGFEHVLAIVRPEASAGAFAPVWTSPGTSFGPEEASITGTYYRSQVMHGPATYTATGLPPGLSIDSLTGVVSGKPAAAGAYDAVITATTGAGTQTQNVRFSLGHLVQSIVTTSLPPGVIRRAYSQQLSFQQILDNDITSSQVTGLPPGFTYDVSTRTIAGHTTQAGQFDVVVTVESDLGTASRTLTLDVSAIAAWGDDADEVAIPAGLGELRDLDMGSTHSLGLKSDGTVVAWGANGYQQTNVPAGLSGVVAIAAGQIHSLALKDDGTIVGWGTNTYGQSTPPAGLSGVVAIAAGSTHNLALREDGTVVAWGYANYGKTAVPAGLDGVVAIAAGVYHSLALRSDGTVVAWGRNDHDQSSVPAGLSGVVAISAGELHSLALKSDGTVVAWGNNSYGQSIVPGGLNDVIAIDAGRHHNVALKSDGSLVVWGSNVFGQRTVPAGLTGIALITAGGDQSSVFVSNGTGFASSGWFQTPADPAYSGVYYRSWITNGPASFSATGLPAGLSIDPVTGIVSGTPAGPGSWTATVTATSGSGSREQQVVFRLTDLLPKIDNAAAEDIGALQTFARSLSTRQAASTTVTGLPPGISYDPGMQVMTGEPTQTGTFQATATATNAFGSKTLQIEFVVRNVLGWGNNVSGQLTLPAGLTQVSSLFAKGGNALALDSGDNAVAWGENGQGQGEVPAGLTAVVSMAAGGLHNLALKSDGTVVAWGDNSYGRATVPAGLTRVVAVAAGTYHSLALKDDGRVVAWGATFSDITNVPWQRTRIVAIAAGDSHSLALKDDGTVAAWGANSSRQVTLPDGLAGVVAIAAGDNHSMALTADGTVVAWGSNLNGQLNVPAELTDVVAIAAGESHSAALKSDGTVVVWGNIQAVPGGLKAVVDITAGYRFNLVKLAPNEGPAFISPSRSTGPEDLSSTTGIYYRARVVNGPATYAATGLPPGLTIDPTTGIVSGRPTVPPNGPGVYPPGWPSGYDNTVVVRVTATLTATTPAGTATKRVDFHYLTR